MTLQEDRTVVTQAQPDASGRPLQTVSSSETRRVTSSPDGAEVARRIISVIFGLIELVIALRIILLALGARTGNDIVSAILNISQVFVAPFEGIFRTDALHAGGSVLDLAAISALIGWAILWAVLLWVVGVFGRSRRASL